MKNIYKSYIAYLKTHQHEFLNRYLIFDLPYVLLRKNNEDSVLRAKGVFFSGNKLVEYLFKGQKFTMHRIYDPAAGCGDLLLRYLDNTECYATFESTIHEWEENVFGAELEKAFIKLLKLRLWLLAYYKFHSKCRISQIALPDLDNRFLGVVHCDGLEYLPPLKPSLIMMNPPFQQINSNAEYSWCSGKVS